MQIYLFLKLAVCIKLDMVSEMEVMFWAATQEESC